MGNIRRNTWGPFAGRLKTPDQAPEPLRIALLESLAPGEHLQLPVFGPAQEVFDKRSKATVLAVTDRGWIVASESKEQQASVVRCDFSNTLLVQMTSILLYGVLRIDFAAGGRAQQTAIYFNTVVRGLYQEAVHLILNGMDGVSAVTPVNCKEMTPLLDPLPLKFHNAVLEFVPMGQRVLAVVHWCAVFGRKRLWFRRELAPQAMLALTDRELLFISEEAAWRWMRPGQTPKYGSIATHCPLSRIKSIQLNEHEELGTLDLELHAAQGGEKLKLQFPRERKQAVEAFTEQAQAAAH
jgi:hypothetical protein